MSAVETPVIAVPKPRLSKLAKWSLFWTAFIGIGAIAGSLMMWTTPARFGMEQLLEPLHRLPLGHLIGDSFALPGLALLGVIGLPHLIAAWLIFKRHHGAPVAALFSGIVLLAWLALQLFYLFGPNPVTNMYAVFALVETVIAARWFRSHRAISSE